MRHEGLEAIPVRLPTLGAGDAALANERTACPPQRWCLVVRVCRCSSHRGRGAGDVGGGTGAGYYSGAVCAL